MPKTPTQIRSLARSHTETAVNVLAGVMNQKDAPASARIAAACALLDRGWGKATQPIAGDDEHDAVRVRGIAWLDRPRTGVHDDLCNAAAGAVLESDKAAPANFNRRIEYPTAKSMVYV